VIDYKPATLLPVLKALWHLGAEPEVTDGDLSLVESAERIVLPGVGHFAATERLDATGLTSAFARPLRAAFPFSASAWACSGSMRDRVKRRSSQGWPISPSRATRFAESTEKSPACRLEFTRSCEQARVFFARCRARRITSTSHIHTKARSPATQQQITRYIEFFAAAVERGNRNGRAVPILRNPAKPA